MHEHLTAKRLSTVDVVDLGSFIMQTQKVSESFLIGLKPMNTLSMERIAFYARLMHSYESPLSFQSTQAHMYTRWSDSHLCQRGEDWQDVLTLANLTSWSLHIPECLEETRMYDYKLHLFFGEVWPKPSYTAVRVDKMTTREERYSVL